MRFDIYSPACLMKEGTEPWQAGISPPLLGMNKHCPQTQGSLCGENNMVMTTGVIPQVSRFSNRFWVHTLGAVMHPTKALFPHNVQVSKENDILLSTATDVYLLENKTSFPSPLHHRGTPLGRHPCRPADLQGSASLSLLGSEVS